MSKIANKAELDSIINVLVANEIMTYFIFCGKEYAMENIYVFQQESECYEEDGFIESKHGYPIPFELSFICGSVRFYIIDLSKAISRHAR